MDKTQTQSDGKATAIYLVLWLLLMVFMANPVETWPYVLWTLFAGGVILLEVGWIAVKVLGRVL